MATLEPLDFARFAEALVGAGAPALGEAELRALHRHHEELARWAPKVGLIGPAVAGELFERHYAESLAALDWLPAGEMRLLDIGSGAGFPGLVLAAARQRAAVWLVEPRERKAAFLAAAARKMGLGVEVVNARIAARTQPKLPENLDVLTMRALRLAPREIRALLPHFAADGRLLVWGGAPPEMPLELELAGERLLEGSRQRYLRVYRRAGLST